MKLFTQYVLLFITMGFIGETFATPPQPPGIINAGCSPRSDLCTVYTTQGDFLIAREGLPYILTYAEYKEELCYQEFCYDSVRLEQVTGLNPRYYFW